jgi:DNA modification methylase
MIYCGDVSQEKTWEVIEDESVQCCITSPPYWWLRDYGLPKSIYSGDVDCIHEWGTVEPRRKRDEKDVKNQESKQATNEGANITLRETDLCGNCGAWRGCIGLEPTPEMYVEHMVQVFRFVRQKLRKDGTVWLNLGDSYAGSGTTSDAKEETWGTDRTFRTGLSRFHPNLKPKDLCMIPARVALALQGDGWWLRSDIIWSKPNPTPESVTDRPTKAHEYIFLLTKSAKYYYDADAVREPKKSGQDKWNPLGRHLRSVWTITKKPYSGSHFATFPPEIPERCIRAGTKKGDIVLDPFAGSGTTLEVAERMGRIAKGIELNGKYIKDLIEPRLDSISPLFS